MGKIEIELVGKSDDIPVGPFIHILQTTLGILKDLESNIAEDGKTSLRWKIEQVTKNSPLKVVLTSELAADAPDSQEDISHRVLSSYFHGFRMLDISSENIPEHFSESTLEKGKGLVSFYNDKAPDGVERVNFSSPNIESLEKVTITPTLRVAANINEMIGPHYERWASFEGMLEVINFHGAKREFHIYDVLTNRKIVCQISQELQKKVPEALLKRVQVIGTAKYNRQNKPISIKVERWKIFKARRDLPQLKDLKGIDLTGGMDSVEYVRSLRDG